jgi:hypothetical protein
MSSKRSPQTAAKRARELAVKEKRDRKRERKAAAALEPPAADDELIEDESVEGEASVEENAGDETVVAAGVARDTGGNHVGI